MGHIPVLLNEVIRVLDPRPGEFFIDGTFGAGGHANAIKEKIEPGGCLLAIDWEKTGENFTDLPEILEQRGLGKADGLLIDLGFSSEQINPPAGEGRGFSFLRDEPLIMTYSSEEKPVREIIRELNEKELADVIFKYSGERFSRRIAKAIKDELRNGEINTTGKLTEVIVGAVPKGYERGRIHPATRTFQALRIYANRELDNLEKLLQNILTVVGPGGRAAIISFHSLEDRIVKNYFRDYARENKLEIITKKPIIATAEEIRINPRARSAKLRAARIKN